MIFSCVFSCEEHNMSSILISPYLKFSPMESYYFGIAIYSRSDLEVDKVLVLKEWLNLY